MTRTGLMLTTSAAVCGVALSAFIDMPAKLIWNASASVPIGFYIIEPFDQLKLGDLVAVDAPEPLTSFMAERRYLPRGVPLLKHVTALPGQRVCRLGARIIIDGIAVAEAREQDRLGRALPSWQGCRSIGEGEVFLLNAAISDSLAGC